MKNLTDVQMAEREKINRLADSLSRKVDDPKGFVECLWTAQSFGMEPFKHIVSALNCYVGEEES